MVNLSSVHLLSTCQQTEKIHKQCSNPLTSFTVASSDRTSFRQNIFGPQKRYTPQPFSVCCSVFSALYWVYSWFETVFWERFCILNRYGAWFQYFSKYPQIKYFRLLKYPFRLIDSPVGEQKPALLITTYSTLVTKNWNLLETRFLSRLSISKHPRNCPF